ncbi:hypothetical protein ACHQM5_027393 [Ranunculus cassubicifolius]
MVKDHALGFALSSVLKACVSGLALGEGLQVHAHIAKYGCCGDICVQTKLIDFYAKCGHMEEAQKVFDRMPERDIQSWNTMIDGFSKSGIMEGAVTLFEQMPDRNIITLERMISGFANLGQMDIAKEIFDELLLQEGEKKVSAAVYTVMITGYAKCGKLRAARLVFESMDGRDAVSWAAMIFAYSQAGFSREALDLFKLMLNRGDVKPNQNAVSCVVSACARIGSIELARCIRDYIYSRGSEVLNTHIVTALIDMHSKCGEPDEAYKVFNSWKYKDVVCYTTMIAGFGMHGRGEEALGIFSQLQNDGLRPDSVCFAVLLSACSHGGLVNEGYKYFDSMINKYQITPTTDHYMCIVDLLGRSGRIVEAYRTIVEVMPPVEPHAGVWGTLLSACRVFRNVEIGEIAAKHLLELDPENSASYVLLADIHAKARKWKDVAKAWSLMKSRGIHKPTGLSWIDIVGTTHKFQDGNNDNQFLDVMIQILARDLAAEGYSPGLH